MNLKDILNLTEIEKFTFEPWEHKVIGANIGEYLELLKTNKFGGGIYRMYDAADQIIYVGKSNDIHRRLLEHTGHRSNTAYFIDEVKRIEFHVNNDPVFQTLLESIFIALDAPKYNDEVKDRRKLYEQ
jgi:hypothetical protein